MGDAELRARKKVPGRMDRAASRATSRAFAAVTAEITMSARASNAASEAHASTPSSLARAFIAAPCEESRRRTSQAPTQGTPCSRSARAKIFPTSPYPTRPIFRFESTDLAGIRSDSNRTPRVRGNLARMPPAHPEPSMPRLPGTALAIELDREICLGYFSQTHATESDLQAPNRSGPHG